MLFVGDDWAEEHHDVEVQDPTGRRLGKARLPEGIGGITQLHGLVGTFLPGDATPQEVVVGIETDRGGWVRALLAAGYQVIAVNPLQVARYRQRHSTSGAKSDAGDAHTLADMVRTDRHQLRLVTGDSDLGEAVKVVARAHQTLIWDRQRHMLRLRSALREFFPAALQAFDDLTAPDALELLGQAPDPASAARLPTTQIAAALARARRRNVEPSGEFHELGAFSPAHGRVTPYLPAAMDARGSRWTARGKLLLPGTLRCATWILASRRAGLPPAGCSFAWFGHLLLPCSEESGEAQGRCAYGNDRSGGWDGARVTLAGFSLPELSAFDPPVEGEGSIDPMGLAAISDRLADLLVPGLRARMRRVRFVTAVAVGALTCETLADETPADGSSTPSICFEWLVIEALVRRLGGQGFPQGVPGSVKARTVVGRSQRLSAATYLKGPTVFGFHGVYKPFAVDSGVVSSGLEPGVRCAELVRRWENEQGFDGFTDGVPGTSGGKLRSQVHDEVRGALRAGRCTTNPGSWLFGRLATSLHPDTAGFGERRALRALITGGEHETRAELALHVSEVGEPLTEAQLLSAVRGRCSSALGRIVDAVVAYERFAALADAAFRTLCSVSHSMGAQPLTPKHVRHHEMIVRCAAELPDRYRAASERLAAIVADVGLEERLGEFAIGRSPAELVELVLVHHERVQAAKPPNGKRPWFEPLRDGWVVRGPYGSPEQPELGAWFVHPVRVAPLRQFLEDTAG